jgi:hypothetical protein
MQEPHAAERGRWKTGSGNQTRRGMGEDGLKLGTNSEQAGGP